jgi:superfamily II DNA or RNA helicase
MTNVNFEHIKMEDIDALSDKDFEYFVKTILEKHGWSNMHVTQVGVDSQHGDGGFDIVGYKDKIKWLFEVKQRSKSKVGVTALNQIATAGQLNNVRNLAIVTNSYFTSDAEIRASELGVELIDRNKLHDLLIQDSIELGKKKQPWKYQKEIISDLISRSKKGENQFLIEMATGLGKTITVIYTLKELIEVHKIPTPRVLFVAHQKEIVRQTSLRFKENLGITKYTYGVCLEGALVKDHDFVFATYHTLLPQQNKLSKDDFDIIIIDECHHAPAKTFSNIKSMFTPKFLIGLSATPDRNDGKSTADFFGGESQRLGKLSLGWAIANQYLARPYYNLLTSDIDDNALQSIDYGLSISDVDKKIFLNKKDEEIIKIIDTRVNSIGLDKVKGVVFCRSIRHIENMMQYFPPGSAISVHSKLPKNKISENISEFREGNYKYILVRDIFNEGIDIPEINLIVFLRKTSSKTVWLQQLGRGLRKLDGKERVEVFDFVGSVSRIFEVDELSREIKQEAQKALESLNTEDSDLDRDILDSLIKDDILYDDTISANYEKSAVDIKKLLNEMQLVTKEKDDCFLDLKNIYQELDRIPNYEEFIDGLFYTNESILGTLFSSYLDLVRKVFFLSEFAGQVNELEEVICELLKLKYIQLKTDLQIEPSAMTVFQQLNEKDFPVCTIKDIKLFLQEIDYSSGTSENKLVDQEDKVITLENNVNKKEPNNLFKEFEDLGCPKNKTGVSFEFLDRVLDDYLSYDDFLKKYYERRQDE